MGNESKEPEHGDYQRQAREAYDRLCEAMEKEARKRCPTCGGSGINPDYIPKKFADQEADHE